VETLGPGWQGQAGGALVGGPAAMVDQVGAFMQAGVSSLNIAFRPPVDWEGLQAFVDEVMPRFA
jgi:alkanesulfonate monooxygenase SsuD/methylene tetrahydromethanopterin reductase-like flavin-dependent oxidoreductase (luciferase family)